jgi:nucleotide-binding universal stress UspA family protein
MANNYKTILFTSNLSKTSRVAFKQAALLATQFQAKLVLLHVMEGTSSNYEGYVMSLFGQDQWKQVLENNRETAKHALVGKVTPKQMAQTTLNQFCQESNAEEENYSALDYEIVVKDGDVIDTILKQAKESDSDLIVMGGGEGLLSGVSVGKNIKTVLKKSKVPVLVVPGK